MDFIKPLVARVSQAIGLTGSNHDDEDQTARYPNFVNKSINQSINPLINNGHQARDIIRTALLLRQKLPGDLVPIILDYAELWDFAAVVRSKRPNWVRPHQAGELQAALIIPPNVPRGALRQIRFITISRDQGWSSYSEDHGTYRGSWTWFEAGVRGLDPSNVEDQETLHEPLNCQHSAHAPNGVEHRRLCVANASHYKYGSKQIVTNIHAGKEWKRHVVRWDANHEDEDVRKAFKELRGGHRIEVSAHARFPGWCNDVRLVVIEVEYAVVRKM
ncbi:hypothetical protein H2198_006397 [Neophaeococcomyces mojaviensis]|uniref:Uncharacterized protein n=1 Tax=Neophaeococcomyces mojaviensis TaxID=3383035 RepID=A0ACC3A2Z6_9EURO|nr:hypothetical protein H2198_006397 [Knufia sp. JES_112]